MIRGRRSFAVPSSEGGCFCTFLFDKQLRIERFSRGTKRSRDFHFAYDAYEILLMAESLETEHPSATGVLAIARGQDTS